MELNMKTDSMTIDNKELNNVEATKQQTGKKEKEAWKVSDWLCDHCSICR